MKKIRGAMKLLGNESEDAHLVKPLVGILGELSEKYMAMFPAGEDDKEEDEGPKEPPTVQLAFLIVSDELRYGYIDLTTGLGDFNNVRVCKKSKTLIKLINELGAPVIQVRIGITNRDRERLYKISQKCGYKVQMDGTDYIMVKEGTSIVS